MAKREYQNDFPSVTQVLGVLRKPALENWYMVNTAEFCRKESARGKKIGTEIHQVIQSYIETGSARIDTEHPDEVTNALKSFMAFRKDYPDVKLRRSEMSLTSEGYGDEGYGYNGTIDCMGILENEPIILDWKTGKAKDDDFPPIYDEYKWQVSAYVYLFNDHLPKKEDEIQSAIIVSVAKDKVAYDTQIMFKDEIDACFFNLFLPCLKIYNHTHVKKGNKNAVRHDQREETKETNVIAGGVA